MKTDVCKHVKRPVWRDGVTFGKACARAWREFTTEQRDDFIAMHIAYKVVGDGHIVN